MKLGNAERFHYLSNLPCKLLLIKTFWYWHFKISPWKKTFWGTLLIV